jgi:hypothetical protein
VRGLFESVSTLQGNEATIRHRAYGVIEAINGQFRRLVFRPWPKIISVAEVNWLGRRTHERLRADACRLYYNQPRNSPNFLALKYVVTSFGTSYRTLLTASRALDEIARLKQTDAIVCDVTNQRISDEMMRRWGWERHLESSCRRHYIKRFYGTYPETGFVEHCTVD